jgi:hypothetical protein
MNELFQNIIESQFNIKIGEKKMENKKEELKQLDEYEAWEVEDRLEAERENNNQQEKDWFEKNWLNEIEILYLKQNGNEVLEKSREDENEGFYLITSAFAEIEGTAEEIRQQHGLYGCEESWLH